ncbi:hypothetical protein GJ744_010979 [Endocarpon pusillum]|uniref:PXMP2/4 family protein 3 n=1 Tax=Endocarpon pusillum TaxID=364733 RepID=A0A8H7AHA2_9EURO|nr:hypothetical protein GJ744_010979 [Endocarpon pusillum]
MTSVVINSTIQAAALAGLSNLLAQAIQAYRTDQPLSLDYRTLLQFVVFSLIATPPNVLWQEYLEENYPGDQMDEQGIKRLHKRNTAVKFVLDQTLGAMVNSLFFVAGIGALKGKDSSTIWEDCQRDVWPLLTAGWRLWPLVSLLCFTVVPLKHRVLVGSTIGVFWGVFLSLFAAP